MNSYLLISTLLLLILLLLIHACVEYRLEIKDLTSEVNQLASSVKTLTSQLNNANDVMLKQQFSVFLQVIWHQCIIHD